MRSETDVKAQKRIVAALNTVGKDPAEAEKILQTLEKRQTDDLSDMEQVLNALDKLRRE